MILVSVMIAFKTLLILTTTGQFIIAHITAIIEKAITGFGSLKLQQKHTKTSTSGW